MRTRLTTLIAAVFILLLGISYGAHASTYTFVGDGLVGPVTLSLDSLDHQFVETTVYRTWQFNWSVQNTSSTTYPNVTMLLPFVWSYPVGASGLESYTWNNTVSVQRWENSSYAGADGSTPLWVEVNNVPLNASGSPTVDPDSFILMSDTNLSLTSSDPSLPPNTVKSTDSFPAWNVDASLVPGETTTFTTYLQAERGWYQFWIEPKILVTPIPTSIFLLASGLIGLVAIRRRSTE